MTTQTLNMTQYFIDSLEVTIATKLILMLYQFNGLKNTVYCLGNCPWMLAREMPDFNELYYRHSCYCYVIYADL